MIAPDKQASALWALNWVLVAARSMAYKKEAYDDIADVLDAAEYLPLLMLHTTDETETFRTYLAELGERRPEFRHALSRFEGTVPIMR